MYYLIVVTLMFGLPLLSIIVEAAGPATFVNATLVVKWFAFWSVGWRLFLAGARQISQPAYTAREILGLSGADSLVLVRELGFANVALGTIGIASIAVAGWRFAAAIAGGVFYGLAGANHVLQPHRNRLQTVAMVSDCVVALVLLGGCAFAFFSR